jgi:hypothetical protein
VHRLANDLTETLNTGERKEIVTSSEEFISIGFPA